MWAVYRNPNDYPEKWVLREWIIADGQLRPGEAWLGSSIEELRGWINPHARVIERASEDAACIIEAWV